jgi:hypothetical protein
MIRTKEKNRTQKGLITVYGKEAKGAQLMVVLAQITITMNKTKCDVPHNPGCKHVCYYYFSPSIAAL